jgi:hypothetical protein
MKKQRNLARRPSSSVSLKGCVVLFFCCLFACQFIVLHQMNAEENQIVLASIPHQNLGEETKTATNFTSSSAHAQSIEKLVRSPQDVHLPEIVEHFDSHLRGTKSRATQPTEHIGGHKPPRLAVVIPYIGKELPPWFPLFASSCRNAEPLVDWLIFTAGTRIPSTSESDSSLWLPPNVKFFDLGISEMARLHSRLVDDLSPQQVAHAASLFEQTLSEKPYYLVEYKPCIGHIFAAYLLNYSHWAFSDLDLILGDLLAWTDEVDSPVLDITAQIPSDPSSVSSNISWDIYTYSFGDQFRMYTRGQWVSNHFFYFLLALHC